jgi:hypothetical protein
MAVRLHVGSHSQPSTHAPALGRCAKGGGNVRYRKRTWIYTLSPLRWGATPPSCRIPPMRVNVRLERRPGGGGMVPMPSWGWAIYLALF